MGFVYMNIIIVHGSPCSGKSTYVKTHKKTEDLVYDYDAIARAVTLNDERPYSEELRKITTGIRDQLIEYALEDTQADSTLWIITTYVYSALKTIEAEKVYIHSTFEECIRRLKSNPDGRDVAMIADVIKRYHERFTSDNRYTRYEWKKIRYKVGKRDNFECQQCKKEGKVFTGEHRANDGITLPEGLAVHHIKHSDTNPELMYDPENLITLCRYHHELLHGRIKQEEGRFPERW